MIDLNQVLSINDIIRILPQKPPATLIDRVIDIEPGTRIVAAKNVAATEPFLEGHYPGMPIVPNTVLLEMMHQACSMLIYATDRYSATNVVLTLMGISKAKFHRAITPGNILEIEAQLMRKRSNVFRFSVNLFEKDQKGAEAELAVSVRDRDDVI